MREFKVSEKMLNALESKQIMMTHFGRSGSTVLGQYLDAHSKISWLSEVLSNHYIHDREAYDPTAHECHAWITGAALKRGTSSDFFGFEVKPMNFRQSRSCTVQEFLDEFSELPVVHVALRRKNILRRYISIVRAARSGVYHTQTKITRDERVKFALPLDRLHDYDTDVRGDEIKTFLSDVQTEETRFFEMMRTRFPNTIHINYEDHIESDPGVAYRLVLDALGLNEESSSSRLVKTGAKISDDVLNYEDLVDALRDSEFEWMLDD
jgi:LPS sulfotransferase NodH